MLVWQTFLAKKTLAKSLLISALPRQGNILQRNIFTGDSTKPLLSRKNRLETSLKKFAPFFNMRLLVLRSLCFSSSGNQKEIVQLSQTSESFKWLSSLSYTGFWVAFKNGFAFQIFFNIISRSVTRRFVGKK
jgi:hypothetical protein